MYKTCILYDFMQTYLTMFTYHNIQRREALNDVINTRTRTFNVVVKSITKYFLVSE